MSLCGVTKPPLGPRITAGRGPTGMAALASAAATRRLTASSRESPSRVAKTLALAKLGPRSSVAYEAHDDAETTPGVTVGDAGTYIESPARFEHLSYIALHLTSLPPHHISIMISIRGD